MVVAVRHLFIAGELAPCRKQAINTCPADSVVTWTFAGWQPIIFYVTGVFTEIMLLDVFITVTLQWVRWRLTSPLALTCSLNRLLWWISKKTSKFRATSLCEGNPPVTDIFPSQRASTVSIWWRHHVLQALRTRQDNQDEKHHTRTISALLNINVTKSSHGVKVTRSCVLLCNPPAVFSLFSA